MDWTAGKIRVGCVGFLMFLHWATPLARAADVLFYGLGKGANFQQTGATTTVADAVDPWEATAFVFINPTGAVNAVYIGPTSNPTANQMDYQGDRFVFSASGASQSAVDSYLPNGTTFRFVMQTLNDGTKLTDLAVSGNAYPNTPIATNYAAMQAVQPNTNFTIYWNAFAGGTTNDLIVASLVSNQYAPYGSFLNSPLPGTAGALNGTHRSWTIPGSYLQPNSNYWVRIVFYKVVATNTTGYFIAGVTGYGVYGKGTTVPLVTTSAAVPKPIITIPPASQTVYVGSNVSMSVTATGTGLNYQWRRSNTNLVGATTSAYSIPNVQLGNAGNYSAVVSNTGGSVTSAVATLSVVLPPAPTISQQPTNTAVTAGTTASFYVVANGFNLSYQWRRSGNNITGATSSSYSVLNSQLADAVNYAVVVANAGGSITSSPATLTLQLPVVSEGSLDPTFNTGTGANSWVNIVLEQPDGKLLIGGLFTTFNAINRPYVARLNWDGSLDGGFNPGTGPNNALVGLALQTDGKPIIGGFFTSVGGQNFRYIARLQSNGALDPSFATGTNVNNTVKAVAIQSDGKVLIGGDFTAYNTTSRFRLARLNSDGSLDAGFNPGTGADNTVNVIVIQPDGKILIGGSFGTVNGVSHASIARLNSNGSLDTSFNPGGAGALFWVNGMALQSDGKIVIGGPFTTYNGTARKGVARLLSTGALDTSFDPLAGADNWVNSVALEPDGKLAIGGIFTNFNNVKVNHITRLGSNGVSDSSFSVGSGFNDTVQSLIRCADGTIVAGGLFTSYNGITANRIVRLLAAPGAPYPTLRLGSVGPSLTLQWPAALGSYQLQASPTLTTPFTNFNATLSTNGGNISATVIPGSGAQFFRLQK